MTWRERGPSSSSASSSKEQALQLSPVLGTRHGLDVDDGGGGETAADNLQL